MFGRLARLFAVGALAAPLLAVACSSGSASSDRSLTLYTCASQDLEQAVVTGFEKANPGTKVDVFRAPTGQLNARVGADQRSGGIKADVIWACDPLTMYQFDKQGLLADWQPPNANDIPPQYRTARFAGIDLLIMVVAVHSGTATPTTWADLAAPQYRGGVAVPSPAFAASALGLLGYFSSADGYGLDYYHRLKANGAVQVNAPGDVLSGVESGRFKAGAVLADAANTDKKKGSPIEIAWPSPGGVAIYAPIAITTKSHRSSLATKFADFAASSTGQGLIAGKGRYPTLGGLPGPAVPPEATTVSPDWVALAGSYQSLLSSYGAIFGG